MFRVLTFVSIISLSIQVDDITAQETDAVQPGGGVKVQTDNQSVKSRDETLGEPERIAALQSAIEADKGRLSELTNELKLLEQEFELTGKAFNQLHTQLEQKNKQLQALTGDGKTKLAADLEVEIRELEQKQHLAKERFDLAVKSRKTAREQIAAIDEKIQKDSQALDKLTGVIKPKEEATAGSTPATGPADSQPAISQQQQGVQSSLTPATPITPVPQSPSPDQAAQQRPESEKLTKAREKAKEKTTQADQAKKNVEEHSERKQTLQKDIELEHRTLQTARWKIDVLDQTLQEAQKEFGDKLAAGATPQELAPLRTRVDETQVELRKTRLDIRKRTDRLDGLRVQFAAVQTEELELLREAEQKRQEAEVAEGIVRHYENPFTLENIVNWLIYNGPKILGILVAMFFLQRFSTIVGNRIAGLLVRSGMGGRSENRANTLVAAFQSAASATIVITGSLMILDVMGVPIATLLGGAAVLGLAVAFGAQNLVRDYFTGFMILLENQYKLNDVVTIGAVTGAVERITVRMTVLRDLEGRAHFIPNGQITQVTNRTHEWSRAVFDVSVAYKESVDQVMDVLMGLAKEMQSDPAFGPFIVADPEMLGVDSLADSGVVIKFIMKTLPNKMWPVRREMFRRIKNKFDEMGIEIPFPHRTIYHRQEDGAGRPTAAAEEQSEW